MQATRTVLTELSYSETVFYPDPDYLIPHLETSFLSGPLSDSAHCLDPPVMRGRYIAETTKAFGVQSRVAVNSTTKIQAYRIMNPRRFVASLIPQEVAASNAKYIIQPLPVD
jgi:hypothetical protein